jgi:mannose-1-phosphate guanylyltransferase
MQIVLLSGGSGKRLWPLSNDTRSKQFLKIIADEDGHLQSMVQRVYKQIKAVEPTIDITIATNSSQVDSINSQLGNNVDVVLEPERRDTFPAIALASFYLKYEKCISEDETVIVLPVDPYTELGFFRLMSELDKIINSDVADLALIGIKPLLPTSKYGYILTGDMVTHKASLVSRFVEKPSDSDAAKLIEEGALWNGGVFAFKLGFVCSLVEQQYGFNNYNALLNAYNIIEKISFDYKVVEKTKRIAVVPYSGKWTDIGTWRTLTDEMPYKTTGNVTEHNTSNTFCINELNIPLVVLGTKNIIAAASPDGILVSDLSESSYMKPIVDKLGDTLPMFEERGWGESTVISKRQGSIIKQLYLKLGKQIEYNDNCNEIFVITEGKGRFIIDGIEKNIKAGDSISINHGQKYLIEAYTDLYITDIQINEISDDNIVKGSEN